MINRIDTYPGPLPRVASQSKPYPSDPMEADFRKTLAQELAPSTPATEKRLQVQSVVSDASRLETARTPSSQSPAVRPGHGAASHLDLMVHEVRQIAETAGFVGVTPQDVIRAYHSGQSFLADYRI